MAWQQRWQRLEKWLLRAWPAPTTWESIGRTYRWAAFVLIPIVVLILGLATGGVMGWLGVLAVVALLLLISLGLWLALAVLARMSCGLRAGLLLLLLPVLPLGVYSPQQLTTLYLFLALTLALATAGALRWWRGARLTGGVLFGLGVMPLLAGVTALLVAGWPVEEGNDWLPIEARMLPLAHPGLRGDYPVSTHTYGSGSDRHRVEYGEEADWRSESVDGSRLLDGWEGLGGWARTRFWGFDASALPVQGRVWAPDEAGPHPIVLIVHGNHEGPDFSDVGYDYLGQLFASRGVVTVSVDENFLNSFTGNLIGGPEAGLEEESDARAWLLLQHLVQWRQWTADPTHPMSGRVDLDRVVLIGHSRGGEAVSEAALFNRLHHYPDDAGVVFDFGFGVRGIIAIAPVDSQYNPRDRDTPLVDTNLLVIHGSHDSDVQAFVGSAMYSRLEFADCADCFKSSFYLLDANHGQFNTSWAEYDAPFPPAAMLNVVPLISAEAQREVAATLFSAFLDTTLFGKREYLAFLARPETGAGWFPEEARYLSNYLDGRMIMLADFEEDADLISGTGEVAALEGTDLDLWKEAEVPLRWRDMDSAAVLLGWGSDPGGEPGYEVRLLEGGLAVSPDMAIGFAAAMSTVAPEGVDEFEPPVRLDFDIVLVDSHGTEASLPLSTRRALLPQVDPTLFKLEFLSDSQASEPTFQRYRFLFHEWLAVEPALDLSSLAAIRFRFPGDVPASIWLDDLAISPTGR